MCAYSFVAALLEIESFLIMGVISQDEYVSAVRVLSAVEYARVK